MKKNYIKPEFLVVNVTPQKMLCASGVEESENSGSVMERGYDDNYDIL